MIQGFFSARKPGVNLLPIHQNKIRQELNPLPLLQLNASEGYRDTCGIPTK